MNFRQIHLDFHTSEKIDGIGSNFSKEQFQDALKRGHVNSITVFSKCHHGWAYHPSEANEMHPGLKFDLLGAQIEAAHEIGVKTPVYLSGGLDEKMARRHPEWLMRSKDDTLGWAHDFTEPGYHHFCMNSPYLDYLINQVEEVVRTYDCDGIFIDIVGVRICYCQNCVRTLLDEGKDPYDYKNVRDLGERVYANYCRRVREAIDKYKPGLPLFHNNGVIRGRRDLVNFNTHFEIESLPTGGWGYDHFPLSAAYSRTLGKDFLGMTGKFHTTWGEFGGFKHPNALRYEEALCVANGAKCSIGDQMHPDGYMEEATYDLIGAAYAEIEEKEPWLDGVESVADIAVLSEEAVLNYYISQGIDYEVSNEPDAGAGRILLEGKFLFDVIDTEELIKGIEKYKLLILPDNIKLDENLTKAVKKFTANGGKVLATGLSATDFSDNFVLDLGAKFIGKCEFNPTYFRPRFELDELGNSAFVIYKQVYDIEAEENAEVVIDREDPYFNRTTFTFSSHQHTPNDKSARYPAATIGRDGAYIATNIFSEYFTKGSLIAKLLTVRVINMLLGDEKTLEINLPAQGVVTLMHQRKEDRLVNHILYASPVKRGSGIEIIEDIVPLYNIDVSVKCDRKPKKVYSAPDMNEIPYSYESGRICYKVEKLDMHKMVVIEF